MLPGGVVDVAALLTPVPPAGRAGRYSRVPSASSAARHSTDPERRQRPNIPRPRTTSDGSRRRPPVAPLQPTAELLPAADHSRAPSSTGSALPHYWRSAEASAADGGAERRPLGQRQRRPSTAGDRLKAYLRPCTDSSRRGSTEADPVSALLARSLSLLDGTMPSRNMSSAAAMQHICELLQAPVDTMAGLQVVWESVVGQLRAVWGRQQLPQFCLVDLLGAPMHRCLSELGCQPQAGQDPAASDQEQPPPTAPPGSTQLALLGGVLVREHRQNRKMQLMSQDLVSAQDKLQQLQVINSGWKHISEQLSILNVQKLDRGVQTEAQSAREAGPSAKESAAKVAELKREVESLKASSAAAEHAADDALAQCREQSAAMATAQAELRRIQKVVREQEDELQAVRSDLQRMRNRPPRPTRMASTQTESGSAYMRLEAPPAERRPSAAAVEGLTQLNREDPPEGSVSLVFTDVQSSTFLWNHSCRAMRTAIVQHNKLMRATLRRFRGYEVKTEGDAFMVAFHSAADAFCFCMEIQKGLLVLEWPDEILGCEGDTDTVVDSGGQTLFRGLRVRMGIHSATSSATDHTGSPLCERDPCSGRMDYFGPMVNFSARVGGKGRGGEVVISKAAYAEIGAALAEDGGASLVEGGAVAESLGICALKGFPENDDCHLYHVFPKRLAGRRQLLLSLAAQPQTFAPESADAKRPAPTGDVTLVFTDVQGSTLLWNRTQKGMRAGLALHNTAMRSLIADCGGFEVKTEGDAFMVAFECPLAAARWCLLSQLALLDQDWSDDLMQQELAREVPQPEGAGAGAEGAAAKYLWRGLRVRMGFHSGWPLCELDPTTGRMDYLGPVVNYGARVSGVGFGGEVVVSREAMARIEGELPTLIPGGVVSRQLPAQSLKGFEDGDVVLHSIQPAWLQSRYNDFEKAKRKGEAAAVHVASELTDEQRERLQRLEERLKALEEEAPRGPITFVAVVAAHRNALWSRASEAMSQACSSIAALYRRLLSTFRGYCVRSDADYLCAAFGSASDALRFAAATQREALELEWPAQLLDVFGQADEVPLEGGSGWLWRGLRLRCSVHHGMPTRGPNPITLRMDYKGASVQASRAIGARARGGEILCTPATLQECGGVGECDLVAQPLDVTVRTADEGEEEPLLLLLPRELAGRADTAAAATREDDDMMIALRRDSLRRKPPVGNVTVVFCEVEDGPQMWEAAPQAMERAVAVYSRALRELCDIYLCYEARTEGDARMLVFSYTQEAVKFCVQLQQQLLEAEWPDLSATAAESKRLPGGGGWLWRGLRVRMSAHCGVPLTEQDEISGSTKYVGPVVSRAGHALCYAIGGELLCTDVVAKRVAKSAASLNAQVSPIGPRGEAGPLHSFVPNSLGARAAHFAERRPKGEVVPTRAMLSEELSDAQRSRLGRLEEQLETVYGKGHEIPAPTGDMALVCVGGDGSPEAWHQGEAAARSERERISAAMHEAREKLREVGGYLCADFSDGIFAALQSAGEALVFVSSLLCGPHGSRVRCGLVLGSPVCDQDPSNGRADFFGPIVSQLGGLCGEARRGECVMKSSLWREHGELLTSADARLGWQNAAQAVAPEARARLRVETKVPALLPGWGGETPALVGLTALPPEQLAAAPQPDPLRFKFLGNSGRARRMPSEALQRGVVIACAAVEPAQGRRMRSVLKKGRSKQEDPGVDAVHAALAAVRGEVISDAACGVESRSEGRCLVAAFPSVAAAMHWALAIVRGVPQAAWPPAAPPCRLKVRVGLAVGESVQVPAGPRRVDYQGPAVSQAMTLCSVAHPGEVLVTAGVRDAAERSGNKDAMLKALDAAITRVAGVGDSYAVTANEFGGHFVGVRPRPRDPRVICFDIEVASRCPRARSGRRRSLTRAPPGWQAARLRLFSDTEELLSVLERDCMACFDDRSARPADPADAFRLQAAAARDPWRVCNGNWTSGDADLLSRQARELLQRRLEQYSAAATAAEAHERNVDSAAGMWLQMMAGSEPGSEAAMLTLHCSVRTFLRAVQMYTPGSAAETDAGALRRHISALAADLALQVPEGEEASVQRSVLPEVGRNTPQRLVKSICAMLVVAFGVVQVLAKKSRIRQVAVQDKHRESRTSLGDSTGCVDDNRPAAPWMGMMMQARKGDQRQSLSPAVQGDLRNRVAEAQAVLRRRVVPQTFSMDADRRGTAIGSVSSMDSDDKASHRQRKQSKPGPVPGVSFAEFPASMLPRPPDLVSPRRKHSGVDSPTASPRRKSFFPRTGH
eukprot:TRINITY_DN4464_c0_g5_i1.p1 TRINITY_DN4464_c0_g5~~TRINITY_DN4464_c0_g5_i1.p1  ORF type:complete len:2259 (+),score=845.00 TRINITY_DN4464_c0_g5_i1:64-6840(+)